MGMGGPIFANSSDTMLAGNPAAGCHLIPACDPAAVLPTLAATWIGRRHAVTTLTGAIETRHRRDAGLGFCRVAVEGVDGFGRF